jgi:transcriptional regulator with XRE-family HTH domain
MMDAVGRDGVRKTIGENVSRLRRRGGLTQAQLAEMADVSTETVSRIERGAFEPSVVTACAIAKTLGCLVEDLLKPTARSTRPPVTSTPLRLLTDRARRLDAKSQRALVRMAEALLQGRKAGGRSSH